MAVVYIITNTEGSDEFAIQPGTLNGPDGVQQNTDLRLPGNGLAIWGEAYNENVYRLTENFAVPEKGASPGVPQDEGDLGPGNGINLPLAGQLWWNITQSKLFVFDGTVWAEPNVVGSGPTGDVPVTCSTGDLFFDETEQQLLVCGGSGFVSTADQYLRLDGTRPMVGDIDMDSTYRIINLPDPTLPQHAATQNYVDITFVELAGDTMNLNANITFNGGEVFGLPNPPTQQDAAASKDYVDTEIAGLALVAITGDVRMTIDASTLAGWLPCDGSTMGSSASVTAHPDDANEDLFNLVKLLPPNTGAEVFADDDPVFLPDMNGRSPMRQGLSDEGSLRSMGEKGGTETHTLSIAQIPPHSHVYLGVPGGPFPGGGGFAGGFVPTSPPVGGGGSHPNTSPFFVLNFLIKV